MTKELRIPSIKNTILDGYKPSIISLKIYSNAIKWAKRKITKSQASTVAIQKFWRHNADYNWHTLCSSTERKHFSSIPPKSF